MVTIDIQEIKQWDRFYRGNFVNSLSGFKSASLIGTINAQGVPNLAIFSNIVHLGADPALIGFINRPLAAAPHTIANIESSGVYTINHIAPNMVVQAHQTSAKYPDGISEFSQVGLTPEFVDGVLAPYVAESPIKYALSLKEIVPITHNNTFLVIGAITHVVLKTEQYVQADGFIDLSAAHSVASLGIDAYYECSKIGRYAYAKPNEEPRQID